jgi:hypothetical protein
LIFQFEDENEDDKTLSHVGQSFVNRVSPEWRLDKVTIFAIFTAVLEFFHQVARAVE